MDHRNVKLPLLVRVKALYRTVKKDDPDNIPAIILVSVLGLFSWFLALSVPSFMTNFVAQWFMTFILTLAFAIITIGLTIIIAETHEQKFTPWLNDLLVKYRADIEPLQKAEIEKVDDILLKDK